MVLNVGNLLRVSASLHPALCDEKVVVARVGVAFSGNNSGFPQLRASLANVAACRDSRRDNRGTPALARQHPARYAYRRAHARARNQADLHSRFRFSPVSISHGNRSGKVTASLAPTSSLDSTGEIKSRISFAIGNGQVLSFDRNGRPNSISSP